MDKKSFSSKKNIVLATAIAAAMGISGSVFAALPYAIDIDSLSASTSDSSAADGINGELVAGTGATVTVAAKAADGSGDTTADGAITLTAVGKYTGTTASLSADMTNGVATFTIPAGGLSQADTYWLTAKMVAADISSATPGQMDSVTVIAGDAAGLKLKSRKASIGQEAVAGAGSSMKVQVVDAFGNATSTGSDLAVSVSGNLIDDFATSISAGGSSVSFTLGGDGVAVSATGTLNLSAASAFGSSGTVSSSLDINVVPLSLVAAASFSSAQTAGQAISPAFSAAASDGSAVSGIGITHKVKANGGPSHAVVEAPNVSVSGGQADATFFVASGDVADEYYIVTSAGLGDAEIGDIVSGADIVPAAPAQVKLMANGAPLSTLPAMANGGSLSVTIPGSALVAFDAFGNPTTASIQVSSINSADAGGTASGLPLTVGSGDSASVSYATGFTTDNLTLSFSDGSIPALSLTVRGEAATAIAYPMLGKGSYDLAYNYVGEPGMTPKGGASLGGQAHQVALSIPANDGRVVNIGGILELDPAHVGQPGRIMAALVYDPAPEDDSGEVYYLSLDGQGNFSDWDANWASLPSIGGMRASLAANESIGTLFNGPLGIYGLPGLVHIYTGYELAAQPGVVHSGGPIALSFE